MEPSVSSPLGPGTCLPEEEKHGGEALYKLETAKDAQRKINQNNDLSVKQIQDFMEPQMEVNMEHYLLPPKTLLRYAMLLDIVRPTCRRSVCFTKGWVQYVYICVHFHMSYLREKNIFVEWSALYLMSHLNSVNGVPGPLVDSVTNFCCFFLSGWWIIFIIINIISISNVVIWYPCV